MMSIAWIRWAQKHLTSGELLGTVGRKYSDACTFVCKGDASSGYSEVVRFRMGCNNVKHGAVSSTLWSMEPRHE